MKPSLAKIMLTGTLCLNLFQPLYAYAQGSHTGGGGNILECIENGKIKWHLLDVWEAAAKGQVLNLVDEKNPNKPMTIYDKINLARDRYAKQDPKRADAYAAEATKMAQAISKELAALKIGQHLKKSYVVMEGPLKDTQDGNENYVFKSLFNGEKPTPQQCAKGQLVEQKNPISPFDPFYTIDPTYWNDLDLDEQVATLYHEAIFKEFRGMGVFSSEAARDLNGLVMSDSIGDLSTEQYINMIVAAGLKDFYYEGKYLVDSINYDVNGAVISIGRRTDLYDDVAYTVPIGEEINFPATGKGTLFQNTHIEKVTFNAQRRVVSALFDSTIFYLSTQKMLNTDHDLDWIEFAAETWGRGQYYFKATAYAAGKDRKLATSEGMVTLEKFITEYPQFSSFPINIAWEGHEVEILSNGNYLFHLTQQGFTARAGHPAPAFDQNNKPVDEAKIALTTDADGNILSEVQE
jgi:hypothetical protein